MPQTLSVMDEHLIFSTKNRYNFLYPEIRNKLWTQMGAMLKDCGCFPFQIGGYEEHVHLYFNLSRSLAFSELVKIIKTESNSWLNSQGLSYFHWQKGYGVFSVSPTQREKVIRYIQNQELHHSQGLDFCTEYLNLCKLANAPYDLRYLFQMRINSFQFSVVLLAQGDSVPQAPALKARRP